MQAFEQLPWREVTCEINTGLICNAIGFCRVLQDGAPKLEKSHAKLRFYDGSILKPFGKYQINLYWRGNSVVF